MWPIELYSTTTRSILGSATTQSIDSATIEAILSLSPLARAGVGIAATMLVAAVVLGLFQGYGTRSVDTCRRSPIISACIGTPALLVVGLLTGVGALIADTSVGIFFSVILLSAGAVIIPTACAIGLVSIGQSIVAYTGTDRLSLGVIVAGLIGGLGLAVIPVGVVIGTIAAAFGLGAGVRVLIGSGEPSESADRTVPPANKI